MNQLHENGAERDLKFLAAMPKVELHIHLEGSIDAATIWEMATRNKVSLPVGSVRELEEFFQYRDFDHFLQMYYAATSTMLTLEDWATMVDRFMANQARLNVIYSEVFISTSLHLGRLTSREWIQTLREAMLEGEREHGVRVRFIPDISREVPDTQSAVLDFVLEARDAGVAIGLGVGGPEVGFPPELFTSTFEEARRQGLRVVAHAGETEGPESIWGAIRSLGAERIGHGIRCLDDPELVRYLAEKQVPIEVNPSSNYRTGVVAESQQHPIRRMHDLGLNVLVNSDDPALFNASLVDEYKLLHKQGLSKEELWAMNLRACDASFLPEEEKAAVRGRLLDFSLSS